MTQSSNANLRWLNATQFLGSLNDNILKLVIIFHLIASTGADKAGVIAAQAGASFVLPFLLFSAPAGCLADRLSKTRLIVWLKAAEVAVTALAVLAFTLGAQDALYGVIFLMAAHSAFFAPAKYGSIPELVEKDQLSRANGLLESSMFLSIVIGSALSPFLVDFAGERIWLSGLVCLCVAVLGLFSALRIDATPASAQPKPLAWFPSEIFKTIGTIRTDRHLMLAIAGLAFFMGLGAFAQLNLISYGIDQLGLSETQSGYLFLAAALGIGGGSLLAAKFSGRDVEFGLVPIGALGLTTALLLLHAGPASVGFCVGLLVLFGVSAGFFSLPLQTFIQFRAKPENRGEVLAASSFINWVAILMASGLTFTFARVLHMSPASGFSIMGLATVVLTGLSFWFLPDFLLRFLALLVMRVFYRIRIIGAENLPTEGPALIIPNHVTWVDALLLTATNQRRIRFVMQREIYEKPSLNWLFKLMGVIPVSEKDGRKGLMEFIKASRKAMDEGFMVCIFAEGALTRTGMLGEFKSGFELIVKDSDYPVIPVYLGGAWGSIMSYAHGRLLSRPPALHPYPVTIIFGKPLDAKSGAAQVRQAVMELSCDYFESRKAGRKPLAQYFAEDARKDWNRKAITDTSGKALTYGQTLVAARALATKLKGVVSDAEHIGILLPPSVGGALTNLAVGLMGKVGVNLNYTAGEGSFNSAIDQCGIKNIVTSKAFIEKFPQFATLGGLLYLEDILPTITSSDKLWAYLAARFAPLGKLVERKGFSPDSPATVIFSSGSTGEPKGVMLTHHNIMSNIEALRMVFKVSVGDNVCAALPFFHSLGYTATLWFPLTSGFSASYHPNPMEGDKIAQLVREMKSTILLATPTFLLTYIRRAKPEDFKTLRLVVTGAEKLKPRVADAFEEKFGIRPLEGYGATELSPVITLSVPDVEIDGVRQTGSKEGSVGHPVPGVAIRVVDPETFETLKPGETGLILVRGPNVMKGYLGRPDKTAEALRDGWYITGDLGIMDKAGFISITDRLSRFSKIGGEMVPHGAVEDALHNGLATTGVVAVTAIPDEKKGERIVVIYTKSATDAETLMNLMAQSSLPNLWKPGRDGYVGVDVLPMLGSGKLDLKGLKELALSAAAQSAA